MTKEELDRCSTCDRNAVVSNGLSAASAAQLKDRTGEQIVSEDPDAQEVTREKAEN